MIGEQIPTIDSGIVGPALWNRAATILNAVRNINCGPGMTLLVNNCGVYMDAAPASPGGGGSTFPWGKTWICGIEAETVETVFTIKVWNPWPMQALVNAEYLPTTAPATALTIAPLPADFNAERRACLCINRSQELVLVPAPDTDDYADLTPLYVLEATVVEDAVTGVSLVLDIVHGHQRFPEPQGFVRVYRGDSAATLSKGMWVWLGAGVSGYGYEAVLTNPGPGYAIAILQQDIPDPYDIAGSGTVIDDDSMRTDYAWAAVSGISFKPDANSGPYMVPESLSLRTFTDITAEALKELIADTEPTALETFQLANAWHVLGPGLCERIDTGLLHLSEHGLGDHTDASITEPSVGDVLMFNDAGAYAGNKWVNTAPVVLEPEGGVTAGADGEEGPPNTLTIGTVTSGAAASATITGTSPDQFLNLVLPKGDDGQDGTNGVDGEDGADGAGQGTGSCEVIDVAGVATLRLVDDGNAGLASGKHVYGNVSGTRAWKQVGDNSGLDLTASGIELKAPRSGDTATTIGGNSEGTEAAESSTFTATGSNACTVWITSRVGYFHAGGKKLYGYARSLTFDKHGRLYAVSGETRYEIDAPTTS